MLENSSYRPNHRKNRVFDSLQLRFSDLLSDPDHVHDQKCGEAALPVHISEVIANIAHPVQLTLDDILKEIKRDATIERAAVEAEKEAIQKTAVAIIQGSAHETAVKADSPPQRYKIGASQDYIKDTFQYDGIKIIFYGINNAVTKDVLPDVNRPERSVPSEILTLLPKELQLSLYAGIWHEKWLRQFKGVNYLNGHNLPSRSFVEVAQRCIRSGYARLRNLCSGKNDLTAYTDEFISSQLSHVSYDAQRKFIDIIGVPLKLPEHKGSCRDDADKSSMELETFFTPNVEDNGKYHRAKMPLVIRISEYLRSKQDIAEKKGFYK